MNVGILERTNSFFDKSKGLIFNVEGFFRLWNIHSVLGLAGILGPLALAIGDVTAALSTPNYSLVRNSISSLALTQIGWLQTIGFLALGLLVEIFTAGLLYNIRPARWFHLGIAAFVFFGFGMLLIGAFHTDAVGAARTTQGSIHGYATIGSFSLFPLAILLILTSLKKDPEWRSLFRYSIVVCILSIVLGIALRFFKEGASYFGLVERILVLNMIIWVEAAAINLLRLSFKRGKQLANKAETR